MNPPATRTYAFSSFLAAFIIFYIAGALTPADAVPYQLTVTRGSGGGSYEPLTVVHISAFPYDTSDPATSTAEPADASAPVRIFDRWIGDTGAVKDVRAKDTTLVMPSGNIAVTAQFRDVPRWKAPRIVLSFPADPVGIIYVFHGMGGGIADLLGSLEVTRFVDEAVSSGYAVVMIESYERKQGLWDDHARLDDNIDMARLAEVHNRLVAKRFILQSAPVYFVGISQGAFFATIAAAEAGRGALPFTVKAVASYLSMGSRPALETTVTPTIFILARNDEIMDSSWVYPNYNLLVGRGIASQIWIQEPTPVRPDRFWGIPGLSRTDSVQLQNGLKANGMLDAQLFLRASAFIDSNRDGAPDWMTAMPGGYADFLIEIGSQLRVAHAGHAFSSNLNSRTFAFFENPTTIGSVHPVITGFTPSWGTAGASVTISGANLAGATAVRFGGTSASFAVLSDSSVRAVVPRGAQTGRITVITPDGYDTSEDRFWIFRSW